MALLILSSWAKSLRTVSWQLLCGKSKAQSILSIQPGWMKLFDSWKLAWKETWSTTTVVSPNFYFWFCLMLHSRLSNQATIPDLLSTTTTHSLEDTHLELTFQWLSCWYTWSTPEKEVEWVLIMFPSLNTGSLFKFSRSNSTEPRRRGRSSRLSSLRGHYAWRESQLYHSDPPNCCRSRWGQE